jgi:hypothetical protein
MMAFQVGVVVAPVKVEVLMRQSELSSGDQDMAGIITVVHAASSR